MSKNRTNPLAHSDKIQNVDKNTECSNVATWETQF